ncbi:1,2-phenylacetyl-CoA epoxidase subunit PaaD [Chitinophaga sp. GCM10012297]|uniref:Phenylacetate-CoA oxygenase subunit PaaJ n=1 Tax=Chitinophaga chungangae TaxID=2821488 RepID=A0ABS3YDZ1_9BACT|nr:1,2-phenylacetyl-CoA epoxidase subunit PaaD [Chitinophaga chungangae]MBO9152895.1 phenylacetate-CoA oxygenase subunit PaaJ [Chitinophaga chungangae]
MTITAEKIYKALEQVMDPEIPVLNVLDLGMITSVKVGDGDAVLIKMIPTFSACPAVELIRQNIRTTVEKELGASVTVEIDKEAHWHSNRMGPAAKEKLKNFGIAPPQVYNGEAYSEILMHTACPHCNSKNTYLRSPFGSTLCRAIHYCRECGHVFEHFKPLE